MQIQNIRGKEIYSHRHFAECNVSPIRDRCWFYGQSQKILVNVQPLQFHEIHLSSWSSFFFRENERNKVFSYLLRAFTQTIRDEIVL